VSPVHSEGLIEKITNLERTQTKWNRLAQVNANCAGFCWKSTPCAFLTWSGMNQHATAQPLRVTVLLVEDDPSVAQMYKLSLENEGYHVAVASDGLMALEMARRLLPDIMFLDIRIPKMDGLTVLETLRSDAQTERLQAVILSNWNEKELVERSARLGGLDHLTKSQTTPAYLISRLKDWLK
jgi:CheY-like chemotaxis protein